jgi:hypothetical protein
MEVEMATVLFANLLLAHLIADFWMQTDKQVVSKKKFGLHSLALYFHALVVALISYLFSSDFRFWPYAIVIFVTHGIIDYVKTRCPRRLWSFVGDQVLHIVALYAISTMFISRFQDWNQFAWVSSNYGLATPALACAVVFCTSPANFLIREILAEFRINTRLKRKCGQHCNSASRLRNAGALIGLLERLLILIFVLIGNYEAAGLTVAAKSILRFKDDEGPRTEFVLVGTLLSFLIAVATAVTVLATVFDFKNLK